MKQIQLTQGKVALVDDEDYGFLNQWKWYAWYNRCTKSFYAMRMTTIEGKRKTIGMHRIILGLTDNKVHGDHINHNTLDNTRNNLRIATSSQNNSNMGSRENSSSKYLGVFWHKLAKKWQAGITKNYKFEYLGLYDNENEAAVVYNNAAKAIHGEFANLNEVI